MAAHAEAAPPLSPDAGTADAGADVAARDGTDSLEARILFALSDAAPPPQPVATNNTLEARAAAEANLFALELFPKLQARGNVVFSPASLAIALAMAQSGARGATEREIAAVLHVEATHDPDAAFGRLSSYLRGLDGHDGVEVNVANRLWSLHLDPRKEYADRLLSVFGAQLTPAAVPDINAWANKETHGRVSQLVSDLPPVRGVVLTSAVYFNGKWQHAFKKASTGTGVFRTPAGAVSVPMMKQETTFAYAHVNHVQAVDLPYRGGLSMLVMLPDGAGDLGALESDFAGKYQSLRAALKSGTAVVDLKLPRWTARWDCELGVPLRAAGIRLAFVLGAADFSGISTVALAIDEVLQKAFIDVNEEGTEAAAVTLVRIVDDGFDMPPPHAVFHADHPFLYAIHEDATDAILFLGRVEDPRAAD